MTGPGDDIIVPNPSYPIHSWGFIIAGANVIDIENLNQKRFFRYLKNM